MWPSASLKAGGSQVFIEYIPDCFPPTIRCTKYINKYNDSKQTNNVLTTAALYRQQLIKLTAENLKLLMTFPNC